ncbi:MAG: radical SAM protein [Sedimentisphaerales bacterium]|nr:radical SAM protein [Sedimentisphaerales bacterium]
MNLLGQFQTQVNTRLIRRKPRFLLRVARHFLVNVLCRRKTSLRSMVVMINTECNCNCRHCFAKSFGNDPFHRNKLTTGEMKAALREMVQNGVFHFALQGGEPFLHPDLDELIQACNPPLSYITLVSNGAMVTEEMLRRVHALGVDKIAVSIDSYFDAEHDAFRGLKGCRERAIKTLQAARSIGLDIAIAVTVRNDTLHTDSVQKLLEYAVANQITVDINIPHPVGNWDGRMDLILTDENFKYINNLHKKNPRVRRDLYPHIGRSGCPAGKELLYMNVYGDIFPCVFMHISIGNILKHSLKDIRRNALSVREFAEYMPKCIAGEDREFIRKYVSQGFGVPKPADGFKIFQLSEPPRRK